MDLPDITADNSSRSELRGSRPTTLRVRKHSHKIRKPAAAEPQAPARAPVIIYTVSPKIIHANPTEFMALVQRLTGPDHSTCSSSSSYVFGDHDCATSSAAAEGRVVPQASDMGMVEDIEVRGVTTVLASAIASTKILAQID